MCDYIKELYHKHRFDMPKGQIEQLGKQIKQKNEFTRSLLKQKEITSILSPWAANLEDELQDTSSCIFFLSKRDASTVM